MVAVQKNPNPETVRVGRCVITFSPTADEAAVAKTLDKMRSRSRRAPKIVERRAKRGDWAPVGHMKIIELPVSGGETAMDRLLRSRALFAEDVAARMGIWLSDVRKLETDTRGWDDESLMKGQREAAHSIWAYGRGPSQEYRTTRLSPEAMRIVLWIESQPARPHARLVKAQQRDPGQNIGIPFVFYWDKVTGWWADGFEAHARHGLAVLNDAVEAVAEEAQS